MVYFTFLLLTLAAAQSSTMLSGYTPLSDVSQHSQIDRDVKVFSDELEERDWDEALKVYAKGGNSAKSGGIFRTLQGFSTGLAASGEPKLQGEPLYDLYAAYWGSSTYADDVIMDALQGTGDYEGAVEVTRDEIALKAAQYQGVWMYVIHEIEDAIADCYRGDTLNNDMGVHAWDEAWAFYAGSLEDEDGTGAGQLLYALADKRCADFETCTEGATGTAKVNAALLALFKSGQANLAATPPNCDAAAAKKQAIVSLMTVPLVQGALRYAYKVSAFTDETKQSTVDKEIAEGWAFASAVLPQVHACNAQAATVIRRNQIVIGTQQMSDGFTAVKKAFESTYSCLGITCQDVGALKQIEEAGSTSGAACLDRIAHFRPTTTVVEHAKVDLDMALFAEELEEGDWDEALEIYREGGNSAKSGGKLRTLQGFSTAVTTSGEPKLHGEPLYDLYASYWGSSTYADDFVMAALEGTGDFEGVEHVVREESAGKGVVYQNVWMYVVHEMEDAVSDCQEGSLSENDMGVHAWDEAWAFYTGSLEKVDGSGKGVMLYALADKRCANFRTCEDGVTGTSMVNLQLLRLFEQGSAALASGDCGGVQRLVGRIRALMTVPLIQGTLRYTYESDPKGGNKQPLEKQRAEGWAFLAAVLPQIDQCDPAVARILRDNLTIVSENSVVDGFRQLKFLLESTYDCLGISTVDVGGYVAGGEYHAGMEPGKTPVVQLDKASVLKNMGGIADTGVQGTTHDPDGIATSVAVTLFVILLVVGMGIGVFFGRRLGAQPKQAQFSAVEEASALQADSNGDSSV